jgi:hypothetical protein
MMLDFESAIIQFESPLHSRPRWVQDSERILSDNLECLVLEGRATTLTYHTGDLQEGSPLRELILSRRLEAEKLRYGEQPDEMYSKLD